MMLPNEPAKAPNDDIEMNDINMETQRNKRDHTTIETGNPGTLSGNNTDNNKSANNKKQYTAHGIRRDTTDIRMDFPNARTKKEAYRSWIHILNVLREIDTTMLIHGRSGLSTIAHGDVLPSEKESTHYTMLEGIPKAMGQAETYSSITRVTTARPIHELKRLYRNLLEVLRRENVFLRKTNLSTTNMVEIGFFLGLHPSLTNLEWRHSQIAKSLNLENGPKFQIYRRRLKEDAIQTSCIVLACAKQDVRVIQGKFMSYEPGDLGKGVDFIPYKMVSIWSTEDYLKIFGEQNQYISEVGAVPIMGISEISMIGQNGGQEKAFQDFLLQNKYILGIEKSNTPQQRKWWILGKKEHSGKITQFLNQQGQEWMEKNVSDWRDYIPPNDRLRAAAEETEVLSNYEKSLRKRLNMVLQPSNSVSISRGNDSYAQTVAKTKPPRSLQEQESRHIPSTQHHTIITATTTEPSTLTKTEDQQRKMQEQIDRQGLQMENMLTRINQMMDTMQQMFSTMSNLLLKVIPDSTSPTDNIKKTGNEIITQLTSSKTSTGGYLSTVSPIARVL